MKASELIKIAKAEIGYKEKASNSQLDDKTANAGSANYTKYARDLKNAGYYNGNKNGYAWCDVFVDWCFYMAAGKDATEAQRVECQTGDCGAGCKYSKQYYAAQGRCDKTPKVGDQVFFTSNGSISHTGIVYEVSGSTIKTVEGNSSDQVCTHSYSLSNSYVDSFGHPWYEEESATEPVEDTTEPEENTTPTTDVTIDNLHLHQLIFTENACYKAGKKITVKGIMVHSTGANNPWLKRYVGPDDGLLGKNQYNNHWNQAMDREVCVHGFIGKLADGTVATYQTLPWDHRGWHAGSGTNGSANNTHIGFEICEDGLTDESYFNSVYNEAVALCVYLCKLYGLTEQNIICHCEGHTQGIASNHGDVMHWFPKFGKSMDTFRAEVKAQLEAKTTPTTPTVKSDEETIWDFLKEKLGNEYGAAGLMGNLYAESALKPTNLQNSYEKSLGMTDAEYTAAVDDGSYDNFVHDSAGYGLAQWTYWSRKENLLNFVKNAGKSIGDLETQLNFLWQELSGYTSLLNTLKNAASVEEASTAVLTIYEKPADQSDAVKTKRAGYGQTYYDKYVGKATTPAVDTTAIKAGDLVSITGTTYYSGKTIPNWVKNQNWYVHSVSGDRAVINKNEKGTSTIMSPVKASDLKVVKAATTDTTPTTDVTPVTETKTITAGTLVKITGTTYYSGKTIPSWVKNQNWYVHSVSGDRAVINKNEKGTSAIMSPIKVTDIEAV